ncbi:MAG: hypothetical protein AB2A00_04870 [Myxococcota bacterium]
MRGVLVLVLVVGLAGGAQAQGMRLGQDAEDLAWSERSADLLRVGPDVVAGTTVGMALGSAVTLVEAAALLSLVLALVAPLAQDPTGWGAVVVALVLAASATAMAPMLAVQVPLWDAVGFILGTGLSTGLRTWLTLMHATASMMGPQPRVWWELLMTPVQALVAALPVAVAGTVAVMLAGAPLPLLLYFSTTRGLQDVPTPLPALALFSGSGLCILALAIHAALALGLRPAAFALVRVMANTAWDLAWRNESTASDGK